jgi:hypothetical protein
LVALALGIVADVLFYGKSPGISVLLFVLLLLGALVTVGGLEGVRFSRRNLWLLLPLLFFAVMFFVRANFTLSLLNFGAVLGILSLLIFFYAADNLERLGLLGYPVIMWLAFQNALARPTPLAASGWKTAATQKHRLRYAIPLFRGLALAIPVLLVFTILLAAADAKFEDYTLRLFQFKYLNQVTDWLWQLILILGVAWLVTGAYIYALTRHRPPGDAKPRGENLPGTVKLGFTIGFVESTLVLALVNLLFLAFAWIQVTYLFSGEAQRTLNFEAYRDYVRRGFGELIVAAVLTLALILGLRWATRPEKAFQDTTFKLLSTLMIGLAGVMLVSAFQRMLVWESVDFYINTEIRLYVRAFIIWLGVTFGWLLLGLWFSRYRFALGGFVAVMGFLITVNLMNPDADVAQYNLARHDELSVRYLYLLSDDAMPTLAAGVDQTSGSVKQAIVDYLSWRLHWMEENVGNWQSWQSFNVAHWRAYDVLVELRKAGKLHEWPPR